MASELKRRLQAIERRADMTASRLPTAEEISEAMARYDGDLRARAQCTNLPVATASFGAMLRAMPPATGRLFLNAQPEDLHL